MLRVYAQVVAGLNFLFTMRGRDGAEGYEIRLWYMLRDGIRLV